MTYFFDFPRTLYKFGNETKGVTFQDFSVFTEVIDDIKDNVSIYQNYTIMNNLRPDQVSFRLYGSTEYYWTFYLMNDTIREQGWPLNDTDLLEKVQKDYPGTTLRTTTDIATNTKFITGKSIRGLVSGTVAEIDHRHLDLGLIVVKGAKTFTQGETIVSTDDGTTSFILESSSSEYLSAHHWEDVNGNYVDITPSDSDPSVYTKVTNYDNYIRQNNALKTIRVIKRDTIGDIVTAFRTVLTS